MAFNHRSFSAVFGAAMGVMAMAEPVAAAPSVVASIKPIGSLVAAVMHGIGSPHILVAGNGSPHGYSLKPSDAAALQRADVIFRVGPDLENFLIAPLDSISAADRVTTLEDSPGLVLLPPRMGGAFEADDDGDQSGAIDPHIWLDPANARIMVGTIADALARTDPDNEAVYRANAAETDRALLALKAEIEEILAPVRGKPFVVFHDAYQYFEHGFDIEAAGSIVVEPDTPPGAKRLAAIRDALTRLEAACVFAEPEFRSSLVDTVIEGSSAKIGVLDPLGSELADGPELYFTLIRNLAGGLADCLAEG